MIRVQSREQVRPQVPELRRRWYLPELVLPARMGARADIVQISKTCWIVVGELLDDPCAAVAQLPRCPAGTLPRPVT
jgi:hypothetical protein